jgi:hypothetical protein
MRHASSNTKAFTWTVALCALAACARSPRGTVASTHTLPVSTETCIFGDVASQGRDTASISFRVAGVDAPRVEQELCALRFASTALRPWTTALHDRWTVEIVLTDVGAMAYRIGRERARDAIDGGAALLATEDLELVAYATARLDLQVTPLSWDRTYLLLASAPGAALGAGFALDAVRVDARPADALACDTLSTPIGSGRTRPQRARVVYEVGDRTARELAERVVAITGDSAAVIGLSSAALDSALYLGDDLSYVVSVPRFADHGCDPVTVLARRAPWLTPQSIIPLVDTRAYAIVPRTPRP